MAKKGADVRTVEALEEARAALTEFREQTVAALGEATTDVQRTIWWVRNDQVVHWKRELKRRTEKVGQARADLERARLGAFDQRQSFTDQRKVIERAIRAQHEAEEKLRAVQHWARELDRAFMLYKGKCTGLATAAESDLRKGEGRLQVLADRLDAYLRETRDGGSRSDAAGTGDGAAEAGA